MSATSKDFVNGIGCYVVAKGSVSGDTTKIYFISQSNMYVPSTMRSPTLEPFALAGVLVVPAHIYDG